MCVCVCIYIIMSLCRHDGRYVRLKVAKCVISSTVMLMRGGYCRFKNLTHRNS